MVKIERVPSGINGLDSKIQGGFFRGSINMITGKTGTGKSAFCASFIYKGALMGEPGFYMTTEERESDLKSDIASMFEWDFEKLEKKKLVKFLSVKPIFPLKSIQGEEINKLIKIYLSDIFAQIGNGIKSIHAKRVVIDSVSLIEMFVKDKYLSRAALIQLVEKLKVAEVTALLVETVPETSEALSGGGIIEYIVDSVIKLDFVPVAEEFKRTLTVRKMRRTDHSVLIHPFDIRKNGIEVIDIESIK